MAAFDDGTPLDAAALQDLDRRLVEIKASIPNVGSKAGANTPGGLQNQTITAKQILGGVSGPVVLIPGKAVPFTVNFKTTLDANPTAVILTPIRSADVPSVFSFAVNSKTLSPDKVSGTAYLNSAAKQGYTIHFYFMVICH